MNLNLVLVHSYLHLSSSFDHDSLNGWSLIVEKEFVDQPFNVKSWKELMGGDIESDQDLFSNSTIKRSVKSWKVRIDFFLKLTFQLHFF